MKHVKKSVLLWYSAPEMYALVTDVARYPEFLPWCDRAEVLEQSEAGMTARLHLHLSGVRQTFTTRNTHHIDEREHRVSMELVDGPFSSLNGVWRFLHLGLLSDDSTKACKIEFDLSYAISSLALEAVISPVFDRIANTFVDGFVKRAESLYGAR